jgi:cytidylate kinase
MPVIALTHEMGSLAKDVAEHLAAEMGLALMRHEVEDHVAERMHVKPSLIRRMREGKAGMIERMRTDKTTMAIYTAEELFELAAAGNVVLRGWGATMLLRPVQHAVRVRITRSREKRIAWLMENLDIEDEDAAAAEIRRSDDAHAHRMNEQFGVRWGNPRLYDLVLNTDRLSVATCVHLIRELTQRPEFQETEASRAVLRNLTLAAHVRAALRTSPHTDHTNVTVEADGGNVILRGIVVDADELKATEEVARGVHGVSNVVNEVRPMRTSNRFVTNSDS